jgi:hypothetical protein
MEFKNLDYRILLWILNKRREKCSDGPYRTSALYQYYSDVPDDYVTKELKKYCMRGLIAFDSGRKRIYLTDKGISHIHSFTSNNRWNSMGDLNHGLGADYIPD